MRRDLHNRVENLERQHGSNDDFRGMSGAELFNEIVRLIEKEVGGAEGFLELLTEPNADMLDVIGRDGIRSLIEDCELLIEIRGEPEFVKHSREWEALENQESGSSQVVRAEYLWRRREALSMIKENETRL